MNDAEKDAGERPPPPKQRRACLLLPEDDPAVFSFVAAAAKQIGIKMGPQEELAPGVFYPAAQKLFVRVRHISIFASDTFSNIFHSLLLLPITCSFQLETLSLPCRRARPCASVSSERATEWLFTATAPLRRGTGYRQRTSLQPSNQSKVPFRQLKVKAN